MFAFRHRTSASLLALLFGVAISGSTSAIDLSNTSDELEQAAQHGNADAQLEVGSWYEFGYGRPKDPVKALAWYLLAASQGQYLASKRVGLLESRLKPTDVEAARKLSERLMHKQRVP